MSRLPRAVAAALLTALCAAAPAAASDTQAGIPLFAIDRYAAQEAPTLTPDIDAPAALAAARTALGLPTRRPTPRELGGPRDRWSFSDGSAAQLIRYPTTAGAATIAWRLLVDDTAGAGAMWDAIVDGRDGSVLYRNSLTSEATASVFPAWPGATVGGTQQDEDFTPWLTSTSKLEGNNAHAWADVDADNDFEPGEEIPPSSGTDYRYPFTPMASGGTCLPVGCSWDETTPNSWETNKAQDATQIFSLVNRMHDWLEQPAIGFDEAAGNFQQVNAGDDGWEGDPVRVHTSYGADTEAGLPATAYRGNASMSTPPDGYSPDMRMYIWGFGFPDVFGSADATIVLHEYTHGLSNRLVVDADGNSTLAERESKAMGEGWSDWYAMDYLVAHGAQTDDPSAPGSLLGGPLLSNPRVRTQPIDCPVDTSAPACPGSATAGPGGYTLADYGKVRARGPQPHDDGEIWGQTLWDLRRAVGPVRARTLITRAMSLSVPFPAFLDMRNAIVKADTTLFAGADVDTIWQVFADRGMGWFASVSNANDVTPRADFATRPAGGGTLAGRVTRDGAPVANAQVRVDAGLTATTDADGRYSLALPPGTYVRVFVGPPNGDEVVQSDVTISAGATRALDVELGTAPVIPSFPQPAPATVPEDPAPAPQPGAPAPQPAPMAPPAPSPAQPPHPTVASTPGATLGAALQHGVPLRLSCDTACRARIVVRVDGRVAGVTTRHLAAGRTVSVRVALRPRTRAALGTRSRVRFSVSIELRGTDGATRTVRRAVVLRRR